MKIASTVTETFSQVKTARTPAGIARAAVLVALVGGGAWIGWTAIRQLGR